MKTIGSLILLVALAMLVLVGTIAADEVTGEASGDNTAEATAAGNLVSPILAVMGFCVLVVGIMIAINVFM